MNLRSLLYKIVLNVPIVVKQFNGEIIFDDTMDYYKNFLDVEEIIGSVLMDSSIMSIGIENGEAILITLSY